MNNKQLFEYLITKNDVENINITEDHNVNEVKLIQQLQSKLEYRMKNYPGHFCEKENRIRPIEKC